ncbi:MAG: sensor histidine kinase [Acidimicrobiales bacterium]
MDGLGMHNGARGLLAWSAWSLVVVTLATMVWLDQLLRGAGQADLIPFDPAGVAFATGAVMSATMGLVLGSRTGHPVAWLLLAAAGTVVASGFSEAYAAYGVVARPGSLPAARWVAPFSEAMFFPVFALLAFIMLLTPTGRLPSARWRRWAPLVAAGGAGWTLSSLLLDEPLDPPLEMLTSPFAIEALQAPLMVVAIAGVLLSHGGVVAAGVSLALRFRGSTGVDRQQLRWVMFGAAVAAVAVVGALVSASVGQGVLLGVFAATFMTVLPLSVAVAISRYHLYDLDRVISRSLLYTALSALVAAVYAAVVLGLELLAASGPVVPGVAAVVTALAVLPLRVIAQRAIDRLLFGRAAEPFAVVSELNRHLQESASPTSALETLVDTVAADLRLPLVAVESHDGTVLAAHGDAPPRGTKRIVLAHQGEAVGALVFGLRRGEDDFDAREQALLEDLARHAGAAVRSVALVRDLQTARQRLVATREEERRRLRRDLHDGLGAQLTAVTMKLDAARNLMASDPQRTDAVLAELGADVRTAIADIRRLVYALRPPGLDDLGLIGALSQHARACSSNGTTFDVGVEGYDLGALPAPVEVAAYRIASEAMTNTVRHARAAQCRVRLRMDDGLVVEVVDDGLGLPPDWVPGVGMTSMRERAAELGGTLIAEPAGPSGTRVVARLPLPGGSE